MDDSSDILGGQLNVARQDSLFSWSGLSFTSLFTATIAVLAAFYGLQLVYPHYRQYQEKRYRKYVLDLLVDVMISCYVPPSPF